LVLTGSHALVNCYEIEKSSVKPQGVRLFIRFQSLEKQHPDIAPLNELKK